MSHYLQLNRETGRYQLRLVSFLTDITSERTFTTVAEADAYLAASAGLHLGARTERGVYPVE
jgi:hypothetical protein